MLNKNSVNFQRPPTREQLNKIIELLIEVGESKVKYLKDKYGINFSHIPTYEYADRIISILENAKDKDISQL